MIYPRHAACATKDPDAVTASPPALFLRLFDYRCFLCRVSFAEDDAVRFSDRVK